MEKKVVELDVGMFDSSGNDWENPTLVHRNRADLHLDLNSYDSTKEASSQVATFPATSSFIVDLNGSWRFTLVHGITAAREIADFNSS